MRPSFALYIAAVSPCDSNPSHTMASQGGVYATFGVDGTGALVAQSLLRGGQFTNRVKPGDALLAVDDRPIDGLSVEEVRAMLRGPEGGQARLDFLRRASPEQGRDDSVITVYVYRTGTEAQEIQVGLPVHRSFNPFPPLLPSHPLLDTGCLGWTDVNIPTLFPLGRDPGRDPRSGDQPQHRLRPQLRLGNGQGARPGLPARLHVPCGVTGNGLTGVGG